jgi:hypothetical protein
VWPLTWNWYHYSVVIANFQADYLRQNWIPYRIACKVLRDEVAGAIETVLSLASSLSSDLLVAESYGSGVGLASAVAAVSAADATTRGSAAFGTARFTLATTSSDVDQQIAATEVRMTGNPTGTGGLNQTTELARQLASLTGARGYVRRTEVNLANADG